jgi:hypothetical protein
MNDRVVRKAVYRNAEGQDYVHYLSWIETYTGLFPDDVREKILFRASH